LGSDIRGLEEEFCGDGRENGLFQKRGEIWFFRGFCEEKKKWGKTVKLGVIGRGSSCTIDIQRLWK
jgi:hypothetical protein